MDADVFNRTSEQLCHLALREPHGVVFEADLQPDGLVRLIDDDFVSFRKGGRMIHKMATRGTERRHPVCVDEVTGDTIAVR